MSRFRHGWCVLDIGEAGRARKLTWPVSTIKSSKMSGMRCLLLLALTTFAFAAPAKVPAQPDSSRLKKAFRKPQKNGWIFVHLEGSPADIGYQHGYLLAPEIADAHRAIKLTLTHDSKDWTFFREAAKNIFWPHIEAEYREELQGIADGFAAKGVPLDIWDIVATNAWLELDPYYLKWADSKSTRPTGDHCSAFVATGSYTKDGKPVIGAQ